MDTATIWDVAFYVTGHATVVGWAMAGCYQLYLGYLCHGRVGFSPYFLAGYVIGDICNTLGCFLTGKMDFQKAVAVINLVTDSMLAMQAVYYAPQKSARFSTPVVLGHLVGLVQVGTAYGAPVGTLSDLATQNHGSAAGQLLSWGAQLFYVLAVLPQAITNYRRKYTGAVSIFLFVADAISSTGYLSTIALAASREPSDERVTFLVDQLPYIIGSSACFLLDIILMSQYYCYAALPIEIEVLEGHEPLLAVTTPAKDVHVKFLPDEPPNYGTIRFS